MIRQSVLTLGFVAALAAAFTASSVASIPAASSARDTIPQADSSVVVLAAGDVAACTQGSWFTARLLDNLPGQILVMGDVAYASPRDPNPYRTCYDSTWGRHKDRTRPVLGNHDAEPTVIRKYFEYFGAAAGPAPGGYYSFDLGAWHVLALNSTISMGRRSKQGKWVAADLADHRTKCTLAFMHHPPFSSGPHSKRPTTRDMFRFLDSAGVDVVLAGHDHIYERFAPMRANGTRDDSSGVRQFVVGTGGNGLYEIGQVQRNSEARNNTDLGVLKLVLHPDRYEWEFVPVSATGFRDSGTGLCH